MSKKIKVIDAMMGIYEIVNIVNNKRYIGRSKNIHKRWEQHIHHLNNNSHHSAKLQRAWNKYGKASFKFCILENTDSNNLYILEKDYIDKFDSFKNGYNMISGELEHKTSSKVYNFQEKHKKDIKKFLSLFIPLINIIDKPIESLSYNRLNFNLSKVKGYTRTYKICKLISKVYEDLSDIRGLTYHIGYINFLDRKFNYDLIKIEKNIKNPKSTLNFMIFELLLELYTNKELRYILCFIPNIEDVILNFGHNIFTDNILEFLNKNKIQEV